MSPCCWVQQDLCWRILHRTFISRVLLSGQPKASFPPPISEPWSLKYIESNFPYLGNDTLIKVLSYNKHIKLKSIGFFSKILDVPPKVPDKPNGSKEGIWHSHIPKVKERCWISVGVAVKALGYCQAAAVWPLRKVLNPRCCEEKNFPVHIYMWSIKTHYH